MLSATNNKLYKHLQRFALSFKLYDNLPLHSINLQNDSLLFLIKLRKKARNIRDPTRAKYVLENSAEVVI